MPQPLKSPVRHRTRVRMPYAAKGEAAEAPPSICNGLQIRRTQIHQVRGSNCVKRRRDTKLIERHAACIAQHQFDPPILVDPAGRVLFGDHHLAAYRLLKREDVPTITLENHTEAELEAISLWLEGFHASGEWDQAALKAGFEFILKDDPALISDTFWELADVDLTLCSGPPQAQPPTPDNDNPPPKGGPVTHNGDVWVWPRGHRLICGNSRHPETYQHLMDGQTAQIVASDPPFGVAVSDISSRHEEWREGSGMTEAETASFFEDFLTAAKPHVGDGALVYLFIDGKGMHPLLSAIRAVGLEQKSLCCWDKLSPGLGSFYRNQAEFVVVAKHGKAKHVFHARSAQNTTVWSAPGYSQFRPDRKAALEAHACTKPQAILMGILLAGSNIRGVCLDPFCGSGSMMLAAERTKRICYGVEIEERFVDTTIYRMKALTGDWPVHEQTGQTFEAVAAHRGVEITVAPTLDAIDL